MPNNRLTALPASIGQLAKLRNLDLDSNQLTALPTEISRLVNLQTLLLSFNRLHTLPQEITRLENLKYLRLQGNLFWVPEDVYDKTPAELLYLLTGRQ